MNDRYGTDVLSTDWRAPRRGRATEAPATLGEVVEEGTHQELIQRRGLYEHLYQMNYAALEEIIPAADPSPPNDSDSSMI